MARAAASIGKIGKYEVLSRVRGGGMAEIFRCRLVGPGGFAKIVALKRIRPDRASDPEFVRMFLDEARLGAGLSHPNIVQMFEVGEADGAPYIAMEYVRGPTLAELLREAGRQTQRPNGPVLKILADIAAGLHHAHTATGPGGEPLGLVHRDVSPQNILVSRDGVAKLLDFGVAKAKGRLVETRAGTLKGKLRYMAPEQLSGPIDHRADVYALGVCLFEATTGESPYGPGHIDEVALFQKILAGKIARPEALVPDYPPALAAIVADALTFDPERRCPSALALHERLEALIAEGPLASGTRAVRVWVNQLWPTSGVDLRSQPGQLSEARATQGRPVSLSVSADPRATRLEEVTRFSALVPPVAGRRRRRLAAGALAGVLAALALVVSWRIPVQEPKRAGAPAPAAVAVTVARVAPEPSPSSGGDQQPGEVGPAPARSPARDAHSTTATRRRVDARRSAAQPGPTPGRGATAALRRPFAASPATGPDSTALIFSIMPRRLVPRPNLPKLYNPRGQDDLARILAGVEDETITKAGCSPGFSRGITDALAASLAGAESPSIYPAAMYYFIVREAGLGRDKRTAARALDRVHSSGIVRALSLLPRQ